MFIIEQELQSFDETNDNYTLSICSLPEPLQLYIFSFLDPSSLLRVSEVCQEWERLGSDNVIWRHKLDADAKKWNVIGHSSNPDLLRNSTSLNYKEIYMRCSPVLRRNKNSLLHRISRMLLSILNHKVPTLAMFGPGLESRGIKLVRNLLQDRTNTFKFISMFPGRFEGVGSGITLSLNSSSLEFNLITLYTATKNERENRSATERAQQNRLFNDQTNPGQNQSKLQRAINDLCKTLDGMIYVVDACCPEADLTASLPELLALSNEMLISSNVPLLILSCSRLEDSHSRSSIELSRSLQLLKLSRPWQIHQCITDGMLGMEDAFRWVIEASRSL